MLCCHKRSVNPYLEHHTLTTGLLRVYKVHYSLQIYRCLLIQSTYCILVPTTILYSECNLSVRGDAKRGSRMGESSTSSSDKDVCFPAGNSDSTLAFHLQNIQYEQGQQLVLTFLITLVLTCTFYFCETCTKPYFFDNSIERNDAQCRNQEAFSLNSAT